MDRRLYEAVFRGDIPAIHKLIEEDENIIKQTIPGSLHTILHLAARLGHVELATAIVKLFPEMASAENRDLETPLHEACREGRIEIVRILLENDPWVGYKTNLWDKSVLYIACERGRIEVVKHLLNNVQRLLMLEVDMLTSSLHVAASSGHTEIVKEVVKVRPDFAWKKDLNGCSPLHIACSKGHLDITRELLKLDMDLSAQQDNEGRTPLHWAVIKGRVSIIDEILSLSLESAEMVTKNGETILHLAVKNNHFEVLKFLMECLNVSNLMNLQDNDGNTILHLATVRKLTTMVIYLLKLGIEVNALNQKGYTALDVVEADASNSGALAIIPALQEAGAKRCDQLPPVFQDIQQLASPNMVPWPRKNTFESPSSSSQHSYNHQRKHNTNSYRATRAKKIQLQSEGLRNARKTITVVAVLIATVTFAAGINPPGGFNQLSGKALLGKNAAFKVFLVCNIVALFLSLGIVNVLVSVIPFKRKSMMKLMVATHKVMWISTFFMASAYIAAIWAIMPQGKGSNWVLTEVVVIGGGCTLAVFLSLGILLVRQVQRKTDWRKRRENKKMKEESPKSNTSTVEEMKVVKKDSHEGSSNSDVDSSDQGYHLY
ncbi:ankyrin repeat-containing protein At5g02620-like [Nicotiana sylvestris]|uniref:Ankyrin repeat-containing protein At5g02620-like n=1 Tax=Nicotiana sylvestris TaxID=4096 RepID=A0A1U7UNT0_NICSY|nr:PREDICTED: ankyrin repeat-containing protein At5g02620-like [Nicotiana sylvestris]XP_016468197.1 PREDICTED: ankyrin repeat-containing protein At5g02620-like [Nicotiana tabacum]